jgi:hypothetical protein
LNPTDTIGSRIAQVLVAEVGKALCLACIASRLGVSTFAVRNASMHARGLPGLTAVAAAPCDACHRRRLLLTAVAPRVSGQTGIVRCMVCARGIARPADVVIDIGGVRHRVCPTR